MAVLKHLCVQLTTAQAETGSLLISAATLGFTSAWMRRKCGHRVLIKSQCLCPVRVNFSPKQWQNTPFLTLGEADRQRCS